MDFIRKIMRIAGALLALALLSPAQAQIAFRASASAGIASTGDITYGGSGTTAVRTNCGSINPGLPAGTAAGDFLLASVVVREESAAVTMTGWNTLLAQTPAGVGNYKIVLFWRIATGADSNTITQATTCRSIFARISRFTGVDTIDPVLNATTSTQLPAANWSFQNTNLVRTGTETTTVPNMMLVLAAFTRDDSTVAAPPAACTGATAFTTLTQAFISANTSGDDSSLWLYYGLQTTAGAKGPYCQGKTVGSDANHGVLFALRPTGLRINVPAGTVAGDVMVASIAVQPSTIVITPPAGWTLVRNNTQAAGSSSRMATYYRVATAGEPASYVWTFSGAASTGAAGGIMSFSGVNTATPIDAENGNTTASSLTHTANAVTTVSGNTMLVGSFEFTSTPTAANWTSNMTTNAVDQGSVAGPSNAGIRLLMAYETRAATGTTGTRTATASGVTADTGLAYLLALRPAVLVIVPGNFNAFETGTAAGATTGVIRTKVAGSAFAFDVVAIAGGVQQAAFNDQVIVELLGNTTLGVALDANNCPVTFTVVQTLSPDPSVSSGRSTVTAAAVPNAWRDVRVRVRWPTTSPTVTSCSTDNFAIRPSSLTVSAADADWITAGNARNLNNTAVNGGAVHKAGQPFRITAVPQPGTVTQYAGSPTASSATCLTLAGMSGCANGTLALPGGGWGGAGTRVNDSATYSDVGALTLVLEDTTFASVDNADSSVAERVIPQTASIQVGRFVPDRFVVVPANAPQFRTFGAACATRSFTYLGQSFDYVTAPVALVTAQDAAGGTTANYRESLWKVTTAAPSDVTQAYSNATGPALDVSLATNAPTVTPANNGTGTVTVSVLDRIAHSRPAAPIVPFNADISLTVTVRDNSEADGQITTTTATPFSTMAFDSGTQFRFGRLQLGAGSGSQLVALGLPVEAQYWNGSAFVTNAADSCTTLAAANVGLGNFIGLASGDTTPSIAGTFSAGRKTLTLSPPGGSKVGTVDVVINLNATAGAFSSCTPFAPAPAPTAANLAHLRSRWCGPSPTYDRDTTARARFGVYRGSEEVIFVRENY